MPTAGSPSLLRQLNSAAILRVIRESGEVTRPELARLTGLSKPTVKDVVEDLLEQGYIRERLPAADAGPRRPGPRPHALSFRAECGHVLGLDIGADHLLALVSDLSGRIVSSERRRSPGASAADALLAEAAQTAQEAVARAGLALSELAAVAVGTPGVVDLGNGRMTLAPQLPGWEGLPLAERLGALLGRAVLAGNEVHLALLAERWLGAIRGIDDALYVQIGVGIGGAILIGGRLYRGATGAAGEIGYLPFPPRDPSEDGRLGPFERAAGGTAIASLGQQAARTRQGAALRNLAGGDATAVTAEVVFSAAAAGDPAAREVAATIVARLAQGIAAATVVLDPTTVVIGGGVSRAGGALLAPLEAAVRALVPIAPHFRLSELGDDAVALGAVKVALDAVDADLYEAARVAG